MKNYILSLTTIMSIAVASQAQNAKVSTVEINKVPQPCVMADYSIPADMVEGAMKKKFNDAKLGSGSKATDGFKVYKGVVIPEITKEKIDVYYRVDDKKPNATIYMLTSKGYDNFMKPDPDSVAINNTMMYLDKFVKDATAFQLNDQIVKQQDVIKDVEKKAKNAAKDGESLQKDKTKAESKISKNTIEIGALKADMEAQQKALELVKTKTATIDQMKDLKKEVDKQESATKKATKNYDDAVKDGADYKEDLAKTEKAIEDNKTEQAKIQAELSNENKKLEDLKTQLSNLK